MHFSHILQHWPAVDWFEVISENFLDSQGRPRYVLDQVAERYPVVMHGVSLSIGSADPLDLDYLAKLKRLAREVNARWISDRLCWTGVLGRTSHDLLPLPLTEESLAHVAGRVRTVQEFLERPLVLENPSSYLTFSKLAFPHPLAPHSRGGRMNSPAELAGLEQWLLATITDPAPIDAPAVCSRITTGPQQTPAERLSVYGRAYFSRLMDVLCELLPCTRFAVGEEAFGDLAAAYIVRHPPHSYTLARLADRLVEYLEATRPADAAWGTFIVELCRWEQAIDRIFDGPGPELLTSFVLPPDADERLVLKLVPGCELLTFQFPVSSFYSDWKAGHRPAWPQPRVQHVALWRRDYVVRRFELSSCQHELLSAIQRGKTLGGALVIAFGDDPLAGDMASEVRRWFTAWSAAGLFTA